MMSKENAIQSLINKAQSEAQAVRYNVMNGSDRVTEMFRAMAAVDSALDIVSSIYGMSDRETFAVRSTLIDIMNLYINIQ